MRSYVIALLAAFLLLQILVSATETREFNFDSHAKMPLVGTPIKGQYIVVLKDDNYFTARELGTFSSDHFGDELNVQVLHTYSITSKHPIVAEMYEEANSQPAINFQGFAIRTESLAVLKKLKSDARVAYIEADEYIGLAESINATPYLNQTNATWALNRISVHKLPFKNSYLYASNAGANVNAYVVDTGVLATHTELFPRVAKGTNVITGEANTDLQGHGTHVAGILGSYTYGVAKRVTIVPVKVLNAQGSGSWSGVLAGIQFAVNDAKSSGRRSVINMSIEGSKVVSSIQAAIAAAVASGMHFVAAAGNAGRDACLGTPGCTSASGSIIVGNIDSTDTISSTSNYGSCVTVFAPGSHIISLGISSNTALRQMSGTSMASPHVAGLVAVYLSYNWWSPASMKALLLATGTNGTISGLPSGFKTVNSIIYADPSGCVKCSATALANEENNSLWSQLLSYIKGSPSSVKADVGSNGDGDDDDSSPTIPPDEGGSDPSIYSQRQAKRVSKPKRKHAIRVLVHQVRVSERIEQLILDETSSDSSE